MLTIDDDVTLVAPGAAWLRASEDLLPESETPAAASASVSLAKGIEFKAA